MNQQRSQKIDAYRRASNYPAASQLYLPDNPLLLRPQAVGGENCTVAQNISGYGKVLSLRSFGAPLPLWRKRHLPRIGGVCLAEGGFSTRRGEMWLTSLLFAVTGRWKVQPFLHHHRI